MATLKEAIQFAQDNPSNPKSVKLNKRIARGDFDEQAKQEGLNIISFKKRGFRSGELLGGANISEFKGIKRFGAEVFQSTLGSKGLLGVAQLPGKAFGARAVLREQTALQQKRGEIFDQARILLNRMREAKTPEEMERLRSLSSFLDSALFGIKKASKELEGFSPSFKQGIGTTLNALATVAPFKGGQIGLKGLAFEAGRGGAFATGQALTEDRLPTAEEVGTGAILGAAIPPAGAALSAVVRKTFGIAGNVFKRLAGGLGVPFDTIAANPVAAEKTAQALLTGEKTVQSILREEAQKLLTSVQKFRQGLRSNYGKALESLSEAQIVLQDVKNASIKALEENGIKVTKTGVNMEGAEFANSTIQKKALGIINEINNLKSLDGKSLRTVISKVNSLKFKSPGTDPERLAFNALMKDLENGLSGAVAKSTPELEAANKVFSEGMQIIDVLQQEFGTVKFANLKELNTFSKKLEGLLTKTGIAPEVIDNFLLRLGQDPTELRAVEAVRGAFATQPKAEAAGITPFEFIRQITAGIIDPKDVTRIAIQIAKISDTTAKVTRPIIEALAKAKPVERVLILRGLLQLFGD